MWMMNTVEFAARRRLSASLVCVALVGLGCSGNGENGIGSNGDVGGMGPAGMGSGGMGSGGGAGGTGATGGTGGGSVPTASDTLCDARPGGTLYGNHVVRFEDAEEDVIVQLERRYEGPAAGESVLLGLEAFSLRIGGEVHCSAESGSLAYENSHHNWNDSASARIDGTRYVLDIVYGLDELEWAPMLTGYDDSDEVVLGPLTLIPTGGPTNCYSCPSYIPVFITEIMTQNTKTLTDETGEHPPWVELCNPSAEDVALEGWWLSNDLLDRQRWALPNISVARHQCVVVFANGEPDAGALHASFELSTEGGELVLTNARGVTDGGFAFGPLAADTSLAWSWAEQGYVESTEPAPGTLPE